MQNLSQSESLELIELMEAEAWVDYNHNATSELSQLYSVVAERNVFTILGCL
jgi:hypothetical protein